MLFWWKTRQTDQWNRVERPKINTLIYSTDLVFNNDTRIAGDHMPKEKKKESRLKSYTIHKNFTKSRS